MLSYKHQCGQNSRSVRIRECFLSQPSTAHDSSGIVLLGTGYEEYEAGEYSLAACCLPRTQARSHARLTGTATPSTSGRQATKWWADGEEPIYYVVSPKASRV